MTHIDPSGLCTDPGCRVHSEASVPRTAADGLRLCVVHTRRLADNAALCAVRWHECELALSGTTGNAGTRVSGHPGVPNAPVNHGAIDARAAIDETLTRLVAVIASNRGFVVPELRVPPMARFVATNAEWLAARPDAGDTSVELQMVCDRARAVAYPAGVKQIALQTDGGYVGCFEPDCPGYLWAVVRPGSGRSEWVCNFDGEHVTPQSEWVRRWSERYGDRQRTEAAA